MFRQILLMAFMMWLPVSAHAQDASENAEAADTTPPITKVPTISQFVDAPYPPEARAQELEGVVGLAIEIDDQGRVTHASVIRPAGHGFDDAAIEAALLMQFTPAENAEGPVPVAIEFDYQFVLESEEEALAEVPINLTGTLKEMGSRQPLAGITVYALASSGWKKSAVTDEKGRFQFRGVPFGPVNIAADSPGYKNTDQFVDIWEGDQVDLTMWLRNLGNWDEEMVVLSDKPEQDIVRRTITVKEIKKIPGTFGDPVRVIQNLPGTARAPFGTGLVVVRGSNPEDTAFYVDGIRVPIIYHLGGYVSIINEDLVGSVDYLPGGYGVEYGRSGGGVINIQTSQDYPEHFRLEWSTDVLDSSGLVQGRAGKDGRWGVTATGRRSYIDAFIPMFTRDTGFTVKPYWWDYQVKVDDLGMDNGRFTVLMMGFGDKLFFGSPDDFAQGSDQDTQGDADIHYGAHRLIMQYARELENNWSVRLTPSIGFDEVGFAVGNSFRFKQTATLIEFRSDAIWTPTPHFSLRPGIDVLAGPYKVKIELPFSPDTLANTDPLAEREDFTEEFTGSFWSPDPFLEAHLRPLEDPDQLLVIPGLRFNTIWFPNYSEFTLDPRIAVRWRVFEGSTLKTGTGFYHQPPQGPDLGFNEDDIRVGFERTWSTELGWEQDFSDAVEADITVFTKKLENLIVENENIDSADDPFFINAGTGRVRGMEIMLRHNPVNRFFGWISYTLSKAERLSVPTEDRGGSIPGNADEWRPFEYDQTHILVALAGWEFPRAWGASGRFRYVTGNPETPYDGAIYDVDQDFYYPYQSGDSLSGRLPPYIALDLRVDKRFTFKRWWLEAYLDLINVVRGENPEATTYNYDYTESTYIRGLPFIPSPGIRAEFEF